MSVNPIAIVPARFASQRLEGKPLADLGGAPLIVRVCENLERCGVFDRIIVAADHSQVITAVRGAGHEAIFTGPSIPSGTDRVAAAATELALPNHALIVNVQGDEPFVSEACLRAVAGRLQLAEGQIVTPVEQLKDTRTLMDRNAVKVAMGVNERALYFSRSPIPHVRDKDESRPMRWHYRHIGIYGYRHDTLKRITSYPSHQLEVLEKLEQLRWLAHGEHIVCPTVASSPRGVDTPEDLKLANDYYARLTK